MRYAISPDTMRAMEQAAFADGLPSIDLMERAAECVARAALDMAPFGRALFLCGPGNNGGDGLAAARLYAGAGNQAEVCLLGGADALPPDARTNLRRWEAIAPLCRWEDCRERSYDLVVDALFGIGLNRAPQGALAEVIEWMNRQSAPVLAVDIPSGVRGEDGQTPGAAVQARRTVTFHAEKAGHALFPGRALCGAVDVADIGLPHAAFDVQRDIEILEDGDVERLLPPRRMDAHKGTYGHVLLIAGSQGMAGAAAMAARGALLAGAGLVTAACGQHGVLPIVQALAPEAMAVPLPEGEDAPAASAEDIVAALCDGKSAVAIGPGLSTGDTARDMLRAALRSGVPLVLDADALNVLAKHPSLWKERSAPAICTPHPGEMARLMSPSGNPLDDALALAKQHGVVTLLKGASTVIVAPNGQKTVNLRGTPAMARGGSGDVLTGIIAALLSQGLSAYDAARLGAYLHGRAGERAERAHGLGFTPMRMAEYLWAGEREAGG